MRSITSLSRQDGIQWNNVEEKRKLFELCEKFGCTWSSGKFMMEYSESSEDSGILYHPTQGALRSNVGFWNSHISKHPDAVLYQASEFFESSSWDWLLKAAQIH